MWKWIDDDGRAEAFVERGAMGGEEFCREVVGACDVSIVDVEDQTSPTTRTVGDNKSMDNRDQVADPQEQRDPDHANPDGTSDMTWETPLEEAEGSDQLRVPPQDRLESSQCQ